jgi:hypothetical protein
LRSVRICPKVAAFEQGIAVAGAMPCLFFALQNC